LFGKDRERSEERGALNLSMLSDGESARVVGLLGGREAAGRLEAIGIAVGALIKKKSSALSGGPVVVESGSTQVAIGRGMAREVLVERLGA